MELAELGEFADENENTLLSSEDLIDLDLELVDPDLGIKEVNGLLEMDSEEFVDLPSAEKLIEVNNVKSGEEEIDKSFEVSDEQFDESDEKFDEISIEDVSTSKEIESDHHYSANNHEESSSQSREETTTSTTTSTTSTTTSAPKSEEVTLVFPDKPEEETKPEEEVLIDDGSLESFIEKVSRRKNKSLKNRAQRVQKHLENIEKAARKLLEKRAKAKKAKVQEITEKTGLLQAVERAQRVKESLSLDIDAEELMDTHKISLIT